MENEKKVRGRNYERIDWVKRWKKKLILIYSSMALFYL